MKKLLIICFTLPFKLMYSVTLDQKIEQLLMIAVPTNEINKHKEKIINFFKKYTPGSILLMGRTDIQKTIETQNLINSVSKEPVLFAGDYEFGIGMRLNDVQTLPKNYILGEASPEISYQTGKEVGKQCKEIGIHINLAPVVDVNSNPQNPIIGTRSFGENFKRVSQYSKEFLKGMQSVGIVGCIKHFPGHGDTQTDSHLGLPVIDKNLEDLTKEELMPFKKNIQNSNAKIVMTAHILNKKIDPNNPASLSKTTIDILRQNLNFDGIVITDALNMRGITDHISQEDAAVKALIAGNDIVMLAPQAVFNLGAHKEVIKNVWPHFFEKTVPQTIEKIKLAIKNDLISKKDIEEKYNKIQSLKKEIKLIKKRNINQKPEIKEPEKLLQSIFDSAIKVDQKICKQFYYNPQKDLILTEENYESVNLDEIKGNIIAIFKANQKSFNFSRSELNKKYLDFLNRIKNRSVIVIFANKNVANQINQKNKIVAFEDNKYSQNRIKKCLGI